MVKTVIVYFSQGGATSRVAGAIAAGLQSMQHQVDIVNMNEGKQPNLDDYDFLGIGLPVYIFRPPFKVTDYLKRLPALNGLPVFVFLTYGTLPGETGNKVRSALTKKGAKEVGYFKARGADYFFGYLKRGYLFSPDHPTASELDAAQAFGRRVAERLARGGSVIDERDRPPSMVYRLERFLTNRWFVKNMYSMLFFVKSKKCNSCGICMKVCPAGNITGDGKGHPVWGRKCMLCLYCEMKCPAEAIISPVSLPLFSPFLAYNVRQASRDPAISHARIIHENGKTRLVQP
ncbi:MAG TPA: EFR1 family ferrodoxin [Geobacteraceae bacterium]|nr:EFR1 family ferrodoxin [Geobacteraceae bacterium]